MELPAIARVVTAAVNVDTDRSSGVRNGAIRANMKPTPRLTVISGALIFMGLGPLALMSTSMLQFAHIQVHGVITFSFDYPSKGASRYVTYYQVKQSDGQSIQYIGGPTDGTLPRSIPVGTDIEKDRWSVRYTLDGRVQDLPGRDYFFFGGAVLSLVLGLGLALLQRVRTTGPRQNVQR